MNRDEINDLMADYLGGEMDAAEKKRYEAALAAHPDLENEVLTLTGTLSAIHFAGSGSERSAGDSHDSKSLDKIKLKPWMRYAAAMILAFFAGFASYAFMADPSFDSDAQKEKTGKTFSSATVYETAPEWESTFAGTYAKPHGRSRLARSWVALSSTLRDG
ncbi:MAG: hypothetical protein ABIK28_02345 [Planctomycetota bacterium]